MKYFITILLLILNVAAFGQAVTVSEHLTVRSDDTYDFIGKLKNQYLVFHNRGTDFEVNAFDSKMRSTWEKEIELEKRRTTVLGVVASKEDFSVVYTCRKKRKIYIYVSRFSPSANLLDTTMVANLGNLMLTPSLRMIHSEDKKTILLYQIKEQKKIEAIAFNLETMKVIWEKTIQPDDMAYYENYEQILINNHGDLFLVLQKDNRKIKKDEHRYQIHQVNSENEYSFFSVSMQGKLTYDINFSYDNKNDRLMAGGVYSEKNRGRANGYFFLSIPPEDPASQLLVFEPFNEEVTDNLIGKKSDVEKGIADLKVQEIVHRHDGGILLVVERNRLLERGGGGTGPSVGYSGGRYLIDYYHDDVLVLSLQPDGKTHWTQVLHKKQYSQDDEGVFSSFFLLKTPSSLRFIFNDEIKPENTVSEYVVKGNGDFDRNSVMSTDDQKIQLRFVKGLQVGANELIVPSIVRNKLKLIRLEF